MWRHRAAVREGLDAKTRKHGRAWPKTQKHRNTRLGPCPKTQKHGNTGLPKCQNAKHENTKNTVLEQIVGLLVDECEDLALGRHRRSSEQVRRVAVVKLARAQSGIGYHFFRYRYHF